MSLSDRASDGVRVSLRRAAPGDAATLEKLVAAFAADAGLPGAKTSTAADFVVGLSTVPPLLQAHIAERAGEPVGMCIWFPWFSTWRGTLGVYVQDIYVVPALRGTGLARRMLAAAVREMRSPGATFIRLAADTTNTNALGFYDRLGFEPVERERALDLSGAAFRSLLAHRRQDREQTDSMDEA